MLSLFSCFGVNTVETRSNVHCIFPANLATPSILSAVLLAGKIVGADLELDDILGDMVDVVSMNC